ncbi:MAG: 4Fe-4S cluster-binding domain-containing protein [Clostridia bacterium]|nr:4Fe-4S cluster-binding domain-containing protein [Clostridia bacterium]
MGCTLCPRKCNVDRDQQQGFCGMTNRLMAAKAFLHIYEEPIISGINGSGTIFFSGCSLRCSFCQNDAISHDCAGKEISQERLCDVMLELQSQGAHNINLVNPTHFSSQITECLMAVKSKLKIPIVWNSSGYERVETLMGLEGLVDVYLPDLKYFSPKLSALYSGASDYFDFASRAVLEMYRQVGGVVLSEEGLITKGLVVRHLVLPNCTHDSVKVLDWLCKSIPGDAYTSLMAQYTPTERVKGINGLNRRLTEREYDFIVGKLHDMGFENGFVQDLESASLKYTPVFDLIGL